MSILINKQTKMETEVIISDPSDEQDGTHIVKFIKHYED